MLDKIFAGIPILALLAFVGWINVRVMEPDLWLVSLVVMGITLVFVWDELNTGGSHIEGKSDKDSED
ncbi:hypothetical protein MnTg02_02428 [bacterium MnTg02]|nr:hypothetical protein MnTg02_02428 [bacterium MnTg02]